MSEIYTERCYCYLCLDMTDHTTVTMRAYVLSECMSCHNVRSNSLPLD